MNVIYTICNILYGHRSKSLPSRICLKIVEKYIDNFGISGHIETRESRVVTFLCWAIFAIWTHSHLGHFETPLYMLNFDSTFRQ